MIQGDLPNFRSAVTQAIIDEANNMFIEAIMSMALEKKTRKVVVFKNKKHVFYTGYTSCISDLNFEDVV